MPSATMIGSTFLTPGAGSPTCRPVDLTGAPLAPALLDKGQLLLVAEDALRSIDDDDHDRDSYEDESKLTCLDARHERQPARLDGAGDEAREERQEHPEDDGSDDRPEHRRGPAEQQDRVDEERQGRLVVRGHHGARK